MRAEALVPVDVEDRHEDDAHLVEGDAVELAFEELAHDPEAGVLAVDLAGVDPALHDERRRPRFADGERQQRAALGRLAEGLAGDARPGAGEVAAQPHDLVVAPGAFPLAGFSDGGEGARRSEQRDR